MRQNYQTMNKKTIKELIFWYNFTTNLFSLFDYYYIYFDHFIRNLNRQRICSHYHQKTIAHKSNSIMALQYTRKITVQKWQYSALTLIEILEFFPSRLFCRAPIVNTVDDPKFGSQRCCCYHGLDFCRIITEILEEFAAYAMVSIAYHSYTRAMLNLRLMLGMAVRGSKFITKIGITYKNVQKVMFSLHAGS